MKSLLLLPFVFSSAYATEVDHALAVLGCRQEIKAMAPQKALKGIDSPILENDRAEDLVDEPLKMIRNVKAMEDKGLRAGKTTRTPWSDSYWPMYRGGLGQRYNDPMFSAQDWKEAHDYVTLHPARELIRDGHLDFLSPSEKYDSLLGLDESFVTLSSWKEGNTYFSSTGRVESWMGLCHGWAPASLNMPEPKKNLEVASAIGSIPFHPSDVKALATLMWARGNFETRFIGGRCQTKHPDMDRNGRPREQDCLDNNPGTFHLAVVNQIGISKRGFIMDASPEYEVWNHPVYEYEYSYINPKTKKDVASLSAATISAADWNNDPRKKVRSRDTAYLVGVKMLVTYAIENSPSSDEDQQLESAQVEYTYDLELNSAGNIIGGEWYSDSHPDFLWTPAPGAFPQGRTEMNVNFPLKSEVISAASLSAQRGMPFGPIVKKLVNESSKD